MELTASAWAQNELEMIAIKRCQATTKKGRQCKNKALPGTNNCRRHREPAEENTDKLGGVLGTACIVGGIVFLVGLMLAAGPVNLLVKSIGRNFDKNIDVWPWGIYVPLAAGVLVFLWVFYDWLKPKLRPHELATRRLMREVTIRQQIDDICHEAFPDLPDVVWTLQEIVHKEEDVAFVEVEPNPWDSIGWTRLKFALHFGWNEKPSLAVCYGFSNGLWGGVFHVFDSTEFDRLLFQGSGQPVTVPEREGWVREHIDGIGKDAFADFPAVSWSLTGMIHKGCYTFVEAEPAPADSIGWSRFKFVLRFEDNVQPDVVGGYGLDKSGWGLVFETSDTRSDWQQLHDHGDSSAG